MSHTRHDGDRVRTDGGSGGVARWISMGVATYLVFALGTVVSVFLLTLVGSALGSGSGMGAPGTMNLLGGSGLTGAVAIGLVLVIFVGAGLATGLGLYVGRAVGAGESAAVAGAASTGVGTLVASVVLFVFVLVLGAGSSVGTGPDAVGSIGGIVGLSVGVAITGAAAASVGERIGTW